MIEAESEPFLDSLCLLSGIAEQQLREAKFNAALHGMKLKD